MATKLEWTALDEAHLRAKFDATPEETVLTNDEVVDIAAFGDIAAKKVRGVEALVLSKIRSLPIGDRMALMGMTRWDTVHDYEGNDHTAWTEPFDA